VSFGEVDAELRQIPLERSATEGAGGRLGQVFLRHGSRTAIAALAAMAAFTAAALPAHGQEAAAPGGGWGFALTPYVWFTGLDGDVGAISGLPAVDVDAGFDDLIEKADLALMLAVEARRGRFGVVADVTYLSLSADGATPGRLFGDAEVESDTVFATVAGFYRAVAGDGFSLDVFAGARIWYVDTEIDLGAGRLPARGAEDDDLWADPVVGLRGNARLGRGFFLAGAADIGGFGVASDLTWQALGTLGYRFSDRFAARAGYRHLAVDYEDDGFVWDVELSGPILGASLRF
jgi:hypothetical protein